MLKLIKWLFILALLVLLGTALWTAFALWSGKYSAYSTPPSKDDPEGYTIIVERDSNEPMFNSPDHIYVDEKSGDEKGGVRFGKLKFARKKPLEARTVFTLPYVEWAYEQSLNEKQLEAHRKKTEKKEGK